MAEAGAPVTVTVVTDSAATLPAQIAEDLGIAVVPVRITVGDVSVLDGRFTHDQLLAATAPVITSGPAPGDILAAIESSASEDGVVVLTLAHDLGESTFMAARAAAATATVPVEVVDTRTAAGAQGLVVLAAGRAAASGLPAAGVVAEARRVIERVRLVAALPDLDHLARSGHVPEAAAWAARFVGLHPVIALTDGRVRPLKPALSERAAFDQMIGEWRKTRTTDDARLHLAGLHALAPDAARRLVDSVCAEVSPVEAFIGSFGTAMVVHSGPGVVGLAWWWDDANG